MLNCSGSRRFYASIWRYCYDKDAQILMRNYMMERFLERISLSSYRDKFILKGGMLVAAMVGLDARSTMDLDAMLMCHKVTHTRI